MRRVVLVLLLLCPLAAGEEPSFNVDVFFGWQGCYRPLRWMPVEVQVSKPIDEPFAGVLTLSAVQDELNTLVVTHDFVLMPDVPLHLPLVTKVAFAAEECYARIYEQETGRLLWQQRYALWDFSDEENPLLAATKHDLLLGLIGPRGFGLNDLANTAKPIDGRGAVYLKEKLPRMAPWDWTGYEPLDALVIYDLDWTSLNRHQAEALAHWVSSGGRLLVVLGQNPLPVDHPLARLMPWQLGDARTVSLDSAAQRAFDLNPHEARQLVAWPLQTGADPAIYDRHRLADGTVLAAAAQVGFGRIAVLAFDPRQLDAIHRDRAAPFWTGLLNGLLHHAGQAVDPAAIAAARPPKLEPGMKLPEGQQLDGFPDDMPRMPGMPAPENAGGVDEDVASAAPAGWDGPVLVTRATSKALTIPAQQNEPEDKPDTFFDNSYELGPTQQGVNQVLEHLYDIPEMAPLGLQWILLLLGGLALLVGPVDYLLLKRLDRQPLTWLTCAAWIVAATAAAYYGVHFLRAGDLQFRVVTFMDGVAGAEHAWVTRFCGIFAPSSDRYELTGLDVGQWWSAAAPMEETLFAFRHQARATSNQVQCAQYDGSNLPAALPINIWSMQCLLEQAPAGPLPLQAQLRGPPGREQLILENRTEVFVAGGVVIFGGRRIAAVPRVAPFSTSTIDLQPVDARQANQAWPHRWATRSLHTTESTARLSDKSVFHALGVGGRTDAILDYLDRGAAALWVEFEAAPLPVGVARYDYQPEHIQVARMVLWPQADAEATVHD